MRSLEELRRSGFCSIVLSTKSGFICVDTLFAALLIAEINSLKIMASLFLASELKVPIDKAGQVELDGNVATDLTRELTDSPPKIEQVLLLLMGSTALWPDYLLPALVVLT